ncbi:MAG: family 78 glycoside hydrolase catalytic domain [Clostridia bacterium]|nr:family 78 glycoside hydrolase catalytic domain [Clostridia bacterium]
MKITQMTCNGIKHPLGFAMDEARLSWMMESPGHNHVQTAFEVEARWRGERYLSGKIESSQSVEWALPVTLEAQTRYFWRVRVWDEQDQPSEWSEESWFETACADAIQQAEWIGWHKALPELRRVFTLDRPVRSARVYSSGVGLYALFLNGSRVGDEHLSPNFNAYDKWLQYQTFDITDALHEGENILGAWLGMGYYAGRVGWPGIEKRKNIYGSQLAFIARIEIELDDGTHLTLLTDESWQARRSPFDRAEIYDGEAFDARRYDPTFTGDGWEPVEIVSIDKSLLTPRLSLPVRVTERRSVKLLDHKILDAGQNMSGWLRMKLCVPEGKTVHIRYGEMLNPDGTLYTENLRTAKAEMFFTGDGKPHDYFPTFTFFGFRYAKVAGLDEINPDDFTAEVIHSDIPVTGQFECSDERVNRLFLNAMWSQRDNFVDTPTDCPQRDERMGWTGDAQVFCPTACLNMPSGAFYRKYLHDLAIEQDKLGFVPVVVPYILKDSGTWQSPTTAWADAAAIMPWTLYVYCGEKELLQKQYPSMKKHVDFITRSDDVVDGVYGGSAHLGDWLAQDTKDPDNCAGLTPTELVATAYYARSAELVSKAAKALGYEEDARFYSELAQSVREAFRREFVTPSGRVACENQTSSALALMFDMLLPYQRPKAAERLAFRLRTDNMHLTTGFVGTPCLCPALSENGLNEYAYALLLSEGCPGWMYEVACGATTMWERWNSLREDGSFGAVGMNSFNHYAFGSIAEWMYRYMCGINPDENAPGFKHSWICPQPNSLLSHAKASTLTPYGRLGCGWRIEGDMLRVTVDIPCNTTASISLPDISDDVFENGVSIGGCSTIERGSGHWEYVYRFSGKTIHRRV